MSHQTAEVVALTVPDLRTGGDDQRLTITEFIAYCARISNPGNQMNTETMPKLLAYLVRNKHWSPFEMASITVSVRTSRAIAHQLLRHRSFSFQEFSQRYADIGDVEPIEWEARLAGATNRQGSVETDDEQVTRDWLSEQRAAWLSATMKYRLAVDECHIAPEVARAILPEGLTPTTLYVAGTVRSWIHYLEVRLDAHAQKEHRELAGLIRDALLRAAPDLTACLPEVE